MSAVPEPQRGRWIPWAFVAFFGVVLVVNGVMIWIAAGSFPGLVTDRAYDEGLAYNRNLEAAEAQARLGWTAALEARIIEGFTAELVLTLVDREGLAVDRAVALARLGRPAETGSDFDLVLVPAGNGRYRAAFELPKVGVWDVHLLVSRGDDRLVLDERVSLR
jgi:nitrogen fixation protein FixH